MNRKAPAEMHPAYPAYRTRKPLIPAGSPLRRLWRSLAWYTPFRRYMYYRYQYLMAPAELAFLVQSITETRDVSGDVVEIGCALGNTTCFLNHHLRRANIQKPYYCIDTFSGFVQDDVAFEIDQRGNDLGDTFKACDINSLKWFKYTLKINDCEDVVCVQTDVKNYRFDRPISFALIDVDLYQPTLSALRSIWPMLSPGGQIVVDDCCDKSASAYGWDGARQAYHEFVESVGLHPAFAPYKLGIIRKPIESTPPETWRQ
jgi:predicted O-methyltransferase YrrM